MRLVGAYVPGQRVMEREVSCVAVGDERIVKNEIVVEKREQEETARADNGQGVISKIRLSQPTRGPQRGPKSHERHHATKDDQPIIARPYIIGPRELKRRPTPHGGPGERQGDARLPVCRGFRRHCGRARGGSHESYLPAR